MHMLQAIVAILAGLLLLADRFTGRGQGFVNSLRPYEVCVGVVAVVLGILHIFSLFGIALLMAGLILGMSALQGIPSIGDDLARAARALAPVRALIGIVLLVMGVLSLL
jgi:predicted ferric reductase